MVSHLYAACGIYEMIIIFITHLLYNNGERSNSRVRSIKYANTVIIPCSLNGREMCSKERWHLRHNLMNRSTHLDKRCYGTIKTLTSEVRDLLRIELWTRMLT